MEIINNEKENRYETTVEGHLVMIEYRLLKSKIALTHTEVPEEIGGRGIAGRMAKYALDDIRQRGLSVLPYCPYIAAYIKKHPEYADLVDPSFDKQ